MKPDSNRNAWLLRGSEFPDPSSHLPLVSVLMWAGRDLKAEIWPELGTWGFDN